MNPCRYFRMPPVREMGESIFFFNRFFYTCINLWAGDLSGIVKSWDIVFAVWTQILHFESHTAWRAGSECFSLEKLSSPASQPWRLGGQGSTGRQSAENKGTQEHELAKTRQARSFKKYILFLNSCQQFLQILKPLEILFPFPSSLFSCVCVSMCIFIIVGVLGQILSDE